MAAPVLTETTYGYRIVGGTDATILKNGLIKVSNLIFIPDAGSGTVIITDGNGNAIMTLTGSSAAGVETHLHGLDCYFDGIGCDFSGAASVLLVIIK